METQPPRLTRVLGQSDLTFFLIAALVNLNSVPVVAGAGPAALLAKIGVGLLLLASAVLVRKISRFEKYWKILFALFILIVACSLERIFGIYLIQYLGVDDSTPAGWALPKLNECFVAVSVIVIFTLLSGDSLGSIYIQKGNLKLGLIIGWVAFSIFAVGAIPMASLFNVQNLSLTRILPWSPWVLIYVLSNGTLEEMLFRGLFLRKLEPLVGKYLSIFLLAFIFTGLHFWVSGRGFPRGGPPTGRSRGRG